MQTTQRPGRIRQRRNTTDLKKLGKEIRAMAEKLEERHMQQPERAVKYPDMLEKINKEILGERKKGHQI
jgi:hypothetical protein